MRPREVVIAVSALALVATATFGAQRAAEAGDKRPFDPEERLLSVLNCAPDEAPAGWKPVAQWTEPGYFALSTALRAYHASSFGSGRMNVDYMVCHLGWYASDAEAVEAFRIESSRGRRGEPLGSAGERATIYSGDGDVPAQGNSPRQNHYQLTMQRGPLMFAAGIVTTQTWDHEKLEAFARRVDERFRSHRRELDTSVGAPRLLKEKLKDSSRAPACTQRCPLHGQTFRPVLVPIAYGLPMPEPLDEARAKTAKEISEARNKLFPHAALRSVEGGCMVDELRDSQWTCACPACTEAEKSWRTEHHEP